MKPVSVGAPPREVTLHTIRTFLADYKDDHPGSSLDDRLDAGAAWLDNAIRFSGPLAPLELIDGPAIRWVLGLVANELWPLAMREWRELQLRNQRTPEERAADRDARKAAQAARHAARVVGKPSKKRRADVDDGRDVAMGFIATGAPVTPAADLLDDTE